MLPGVGGDEAGDHVEHGGLAGAVGTQQAHGFAAADREADAPRTTIALFVAFLDVLRDQPALMGREAALARPYSPYPGRRAAPWGLTGGATVSFGRAAVLKVAVKGDRLWACHTRRRLEARVKCEGDRRHGALVQSGESVADQPCNAFSGRPPGGGRGSCFFLGLGLAGAAFFLFVQFISCGKKTALARPFRLGRRFGRLLVTQPPPGRRGDGILRGGVDLALAGRHCRSAGAYRGPCSCRATARRCRPS